MISPEQARGALVTEQSDIYSLGIILYELITGKLPYDGDTPISIALKHLQEMPEMPGQIGKAEELDGVILRAIAKSTNDRYLNVKELLDDLTRVKAGQPVAFMPSGNRYDEDMTKLHQGLTGQVGRNIQTPELPTKKKGKRIKIGKYEVAPYILVLPALTLLALIVTIAAFVTFVTGKEFDVPNLVGMTFTEAQAEIKKVGLILDENVREAYSDEHPENIVIQQSLEAGSRTKGGRKITLTVSLGSEEIEMPYLIGRTLDEAYDALSAKGIKRDQVNVTYVKDEDKTPNTVLSQSPAENEKHKRSDTVRLEVSEATEQIMSDFTKGESDYLEVQVLLQSQGYRVMTRTAFHETYKNGRVIKTDPAPGAKLTQGQVITITYATGGIEDP
jgi:serine/threonine-protein kinase